jgi:hypothetical protein
MSSYARVKNLEDEVYVKREPLIVRCLGSKVTMCATLLFLVIFVTYSVIPWMVGMKDSPVVYSSGNSQETGNYTSGFNSTGVQSYICVLKEPATDADVDKTINQFNAEFPGFQLGNKYTTVLKGFSFTVPFSFGARVKQFVNDLQSVASIEEDQVVHAFKAGA